MPDKKYRLCIDGKYIETTEKACREYKRADEKERYFMELLRRAKNVKRGRGKGEYFPCNVSQAKRRF